MIKRIGSAGSAFCDAIYRRQALDRAAPTTPLDPCRNEE
jgi:hypothetical protein